jgi:hypothetical protein
MVDFPATEPASETGLMARESLDSGSRRFAITMLPASEGSEAGQVRYRVRIREGTGGADRQIDPEIPDRAFDLQATNQWLRMTRHGNRFTVFASPDGLAWARLFSQVFDLPQQLCFGLMVADGGTKTGASVWFTIPSERRQAWYYPSSEDCLKCHTGAAGYVLGLNTRQANQSVHYEHSGVTDNQIRAWNHIGLFGEPVEDSQIASFEHLVALTNNVESLESRVRSYLDSNCSQCHRPGGAPVAWDARFDTPLVSQGIVGNGVGLTLHRTGAKVVAPGDLYRSILYQRLNSVGQIRMPPLAKSTVDEDGADALEAWIDSLPR